MATKYLHHPGLDVVKAVDDTKQAYRALVACGWTVSATIPVSIRDGQGKRCFPGSTNTGTPPAIF